jgi:hypothetical protein
MPEKILFRLVTIDSSLFFADTGHLREPD